MCIKLLHSVFKSPTTVLLAARFKLGTNEIYVVNNVMPTLLGPTEVAHVMAQFCEAQTEETDMKMHLDSCGLGWGPVVGCFEHYNERSDFKNVVEFLN
jgi:hypothetical protein